MNFDYKILLIEKKRGFTLVEAVIGVAVALFIVIGVSGVFSFYLREGLTQPKAVASSFLVEEGVEAVLLMRDKGWDNISSLVSGAPYFLFWDGFNWSATTTPIMIDGMFQRQIVLNDVYRRDSDKDIVASTSPDAKTLDVGTRVLTVRVNYGGLEKSITTYVTNLFE